MITAALVHTLGLEASAEDPSRTVRAAAVSPLVAAAQIPRRPNVVGRTYAVAESALRRLRITVVARDSFVASGSSGIVLRQIPVAGTLVRPGAVDTLIVSHPRTQRFTAVPAVIGMLLPSAVAQIGRAGLVPVAPGVSPRDSGRALVVSQSPAPAERVPLRASVKLDVIIDDRTRVPALVGRDTATARQLLTRARLAVGPISLAFHERFPAGIVMDQKPEAEDSIRRGTGVALRVSRGRHPDTTAVTVPSVLDLTLDDARATLTDNRLALGHVDTVRLENGRGRVVHQEPHPGDPAHVGDAVQVTVAVPRPTAIVPTLVGLARSQAEDTLQRLRLALGVVRIVLDTAAPDNVIVGQSVASGSRLPLGESVGIDLNRRPQIERIAVPRLVGLSLPQAADTIVRHGLTVGSLTERPDRASDVVLEQRPREGERVVPGSPVALVVGRDTTPPPPALVAVPSVVGWAVPRAFAALESRGLGNIVVDSEPTAGRDAAWFVSDQAPEAGELVLPSTLVRLRARPVVTLPVPDLRGRSEVDAELEAASAGFRLRVVNRTRAPRLSGTRVTVQVPAPPARIAPGSRLDVTISYPVRPVILLVGALAGVAAAATVAWRTRLLRPSVRATMQSEPPTLVDPLGDSLVRAEVSLKVEVEFLEPELSCERDNIILRERRRG